MNKATNPTIANADLWSRYFQDQWSQWLTPFGARRSTEPVTQVAEGTGARVAGFLSLVATGPMAWLYANNMSPISEIRGDDTAAHETAPLPLECELESIEETAAA